MAVASMLSSAIKRWMVAITSSHCNSLGARSIQSSKPPNFGPYKILYRCSVTNPPRGGSGRRLWGRNSVDSFARRCIRDLKVGQLPKQRTPPSRNILHKSLSVLGNLFGCNQFGNPLGWNLNQSFQDCLGATITRTSQKHFT